MAVLKAYLDDSGDGDDPSHEYLTIAGYLADEEGWAHFEPRWQQTLDKAQVPYLHMREFGDPKSPIYGHLKGTPREAEFLGDLIRIIHESAPVTPATTVCLADLRAFNAEHGLELDPYAVGLYGCLIQMRWLFRTETIEVVVDKFTKSSKRAGLAWEYAHSDCFQEMNANQLHPILLQDDESWREILPLQAADFVAWEVRKFRQDHSKFVVGDDIRDSREAVINSFREWQDTHKSRQRGSFKAMIRSALYRPLHVVMDRHRLAEILERHPNGWGEQ